MTVMPNTAKGPVRPVALRTLEAMELDAVEIRNMLCLTQGHFDHMFIEDRKVRARLIAEVDWEVLHFALQNLAGRVVSLQQSLMQLVEDEGGKPDA